MRNFQRDPNPSDGWTVDWNVEDHLKYLSPSSDVHLRHTDLTRGAEVELAESWVAVGLYGGTAEAWIPSVLVRRHAAQSPLASTFVGVLEPYERKSNLAAIRRLELQDAGGKSCADGDVGIEVRLADGRKDVFISKNVEAKSTSSSGDSLVVEKESGARFEGDLCLVRFDAAKQPRRVLFCRGKSLRVGELFIQAKSEGESFEIDLKNHESPIVAGSADAVALIEVAGVGIFPK